MDSNKVEQLLEMYFEGETTLKQEQELHTYFTGRTVALHLESYVGIFSAFAKAQQEKPSAPIILPSSKPNYKWLAGVAVVLLIAFGILTQNSFEDKNYSGTYKNQEVAVLKTKQALGMMSIMIQESTAQLRTVKEFENSTNRIFKQ